MGNTTELEENINSAVQEAIPIQQVEDHEQEEDQASEEVDYSRFSKQELEKLIDKLAKSAPLQEQYSSFRKIRPVLEQMEEAEKQAAYDKFVSEGGSPDDFEFRHDELYRRAGKIFQQVRGQYQQNIKDLALKKEQNLRTKTELLEKLRSLAQDMESTASYKKFKEILETWRATGPVPSEYTNELWANYHALVNRFYDKRSIHHELKDLDRKKNLDIKLEICRKAELLAAEPKIFKALKELEELHEEFRHAGPVPADQQEEIWNRLKQASNLLYERKKQQQEELKSEYSRNLEAKKAIVEQARVLTEFSSTRIDEWVEKTKEAVALQETWKKSGQTEKEDAKEINKTFWANLKQFYQHKSAFFGEIEKHRKENLALKTQLCEQAEALALGTDSESATKEIIQLQHKWKEIGAVPIKQKDKIYLRFKTACDQFFQQKRKAVSDAQAVFERNTETKKSFSEKLLNTSTETAPTPQSLETALQEWLSIGRTPEKDAHKTQQQFLETLGKLADKVSWTSSAEKDLFLFKAKLETMHAHAATESDFRALETSLRKQLREDENNIALWNNNMEFFARAKNAESIRNEFKTKIAEGTKNLEIIRKKINLVGQALRSGK